MNHPAELPRSDVFKGIEWLGPREVPTHGERSMLLKRTAAVAALVLLAFLLAGFAAEPPPKPRPLVGITSDYRDKTSSVAVSMNYAQAVIDAGGVPVILPVTADEEVLKAYVARLDALVLTGGSDIAPEAYGEKPDPKVKPITSKRYECERRLIAMWLETHKPLLGICLGMQFANVVRGGTLVRDIPTDVGTKVAHKAAGKDAEHTVTIDEGSELAKILRPGEIKVNSAHHQAVKDVGEDLKAVARSADGVIEAMERTDGGFCLLVQWHPERHPDALHRSAIFGALVKATEKKP
jgi:putative glutamine amidotransferase